MTYFLLLLGFRDEITTRTGVCASCKKGVDDKSQQPLFLYERHGKSEDGVKVGSLCSLCYERMEKVSSPRFGALVVHVSLTLVHVSLTFILTNSY